MVSVIMPAYNAEKTVEQSVRSVLAQTEKDFELIVVDDGSEDRTYEILSGLKSEDDRIYLLRNDPNVGVSVSRNRAIAAAKGEWIAFCDSDDLWREDKLAYQLAVAEKHPDAALLFTASGFVCNDGTQIGYVLPAEETVDFKRLLHHNQLSCSSVMVRATTLRNISFPGDHLHEDYYTWLSVLKNGGYAYGIDQPLLIYRLTENSRSSNAWRSTKMLFRTYRAIGLSFFAACMRVPPNLLYVLKKKNNQKKSMSKVPTAIGESKKRGTNKRI